MITDEGKGNSGEIIKVVAYYNACFFPKAPVKIGDKGNGFGIIKWEVHDILKGSPTLDRDSSIVVKGDYGIKPDPAVPHVLLLKEEESERYGKEYILLYINQSVNLTKASNIKAFLRTFLSPGQVEELYKVYPNPIEYIEKHDFEALQKVKGIGPYISQKIVDRFEDSKDMSRVFIELSDYGLTPNFINRLKNTYKNPEIIIDVVKNRPYELCYKMDGVGFKTADEIAMRGDMSYQSYERIMAYIYYFLRQEAYENGNSYITAGELLTEVYEFFGGKDKIEVYCCEPKYDYAGTNIGLAMQLLQDEGIITVEDNENKSRRRVYLNNIYNLEYEIAYHLNRILKAPNTFIYDDWKEKVKKLEEKQGFAFDEDQMAGIKLGLDNQVCLINGGAGCVDGDTEFFTGNGWKKISEYVEGDKVLQWTPPELNKFTVNTTHNNKVALSNGIATLVDPISYIKKPCDNLWHFETKYGLSQTVCDEHRVVYVTDRGNLKETNISTIKEKQLGSGWNGSFITSFNYGSTGINLTNDEIRLMVAVIADGYFPNNTNRCIFNLKKDRKKNRIKQLLNNCGIEYTIQEKNNNYSLIIANVPRHERYYSDYWYSCNNEQLKVVIDEAKYWDGSIDYTKSTKQRIRFYTTSKESADFIQFAYSSCGIRSTLKTYNRVGSKRKTLNNKIYEYKTIEYCVIPSDQSLIGMCRDNRKDHIKTKIDQVKTTDGYKYCFTVPSSYLILRKDDKIFITGNCGKSSLVSGILASLYGYSFAQTALAGKAAARLQEVTGKEGSTIHRLLGYTMGSFTFNESNKLPYDIIVLDEISLVGGEIFLDLLKAIKTGTKLIILGDDGQLPSISLLNIAYDLKNSSVIPSVNLTKIHRQAAKSGIISSSFDIRNQHSLFSSHADGVEIKGEMQDMYFDLSPSKEDSREKAVKWFQKAYASKLCDNNIMNIQMISPVKERGDSCIFNLNQDIQKIVNKKDERYNSFIEIGTKDKPSKIFRDDKVICIKNTYNIFDVDGMPAQIFNGWTGKVTYVDDNGDVTVNFPLATKEVVIPSKTAKEILNLGYAISVHKSQGSDYPIIIGVIDYCTPPKMLTTSLVYTLITRAKKRCIMVAQSPALNAACTTNYVPNKRTFLCEILEHFSSNL